jgi:hypothetical protein
VTPKPVPSADLTIGPIEAVIDADAVAAYRRATGLEGGAPAGSRVPATFPAIWLWHPEAMAAVAEASASGTHAPILVAQRFAYAQALAVGERYRFTIRRFRDAGDASAMAIEATVRRLDGSLAATFRASYRLVALGADLAA